MSRLKESNTRPDPGNFSSKTDIAVLEKRGILLVGRWWSMIRTEWRKKGKDLTSSSTQTLFTSPSLLLFSLLPSSYSSFIFLLLPLSSPPLPPLKHPKPLHILTLKLLRPQKLHIPQRICIQKRSFPFSILFFSSWSPSSSSSSSIFHDFPPIRFFKSTGLKNVGNMSLIIPFVKGGLG